MARLFDFDPFLGDLPNDVVTPVDRADFAAIVPATPAQLAKLLLSMPAPEGGFPADSLGDLITGGVSVKQFGAVGDGVADDRAAIQAAEDAANARYLSEGRPAELLFPEGDFAITASLVKRSGVHWRGIGKIRRRDNAAPTGAAFTLVTAENVDDWSIDGLELEAIADDIFAAAGLTETSLIGGHNGCLDVRQCDRWEVRNCRFRKYRHGFIIQGSNGYSVHFNKFLAETGKTIASMLDGTIVFPGGDVPPSTGSILQHYNPVTAPALNGYSQPNRQFSLIGNYIENVGLDVAMQVYLHVFNDQPCVVANNVVNGSTTGIQLYCAQQVGNEPVAPTILAKAQIIGNIVHNCWEQGLYLRGVIGAQISGLWLERCALRGAHQACMGSLVLRENPFESNPLATAALVDTFGVTIDNVTVYNHCRSGVTSDSAVRIEHNNVKIRNLNIIRDRVAFPAKEGTAVIVDNGKRLYNGDYSDIWIDNFVTAILHSGVYTVHAYNSSKYIYDRIKVRHCTIGIDLDMRRVGLHRVTRCDFADISGVALSVRYAVGILIEGNDFEDCSEGIHVKEGTQASYIPTLLTANVVTAGFRGGAAVMVRNNCFWNVTTPHQFSATGTGDTSFSSRVHVWEGDRINGQFVGLLTAGATPASVSTKSWSIGEVSRSSAPAIGGPKERVCSAPGTYGSAVTPTVTTTAASAVVSTISSLSSVGPGIYVTIVGVTGTKLIKDIDIPTQRIVAGTTGQVNFTLDFTPAALADIGVLKANSIVSSGLSLAGNVLTFAVAPGTPELPVQIEVMHIAAATLTLDSVCDASVSGAVMARATPTFYTEPYIVAQGQLTWSGGLATLTTTITGVTTADRAFASIRTKPTEVATLNRVATGTGTLLLELTAANTSNNAVIDYQIIRTT